MIISSEISYSICLSFSEIVDDGGADPQFWKNSSWTQGLGEKSLFYGEKNPKTLHNFFYGFLIHIKKTFYKKNWVKTALPGLSSGRNNLQTPIRGCHRQLDDQHRNPNMNNKDHHVGQLTMVMLTSRSRGKRGINIQGQLSRLREGRK